jgi:hypothetical protein
MYRLARKSNKPGYRTYVDLSGKFQSLSNEIVSQKDKMTEATLDNVIGTIKMVEEKMRKEKLEGMNLTVSVSLGPIGISLSKRIGNEKE